jgi:hypothetical protein
MPVRLVGSVQANHKAARFGNVIRNYSPKIVALC